MAHHHTSSRFSDQCTNSALLLGLGAGLMYLLDPESGRRRRALARDQFIHAINQIEDGIGVTTRDARNRMQGVVAELRHLGSTEQVSDQIVVERVRSKLGRCVSHPHAVHVEASDGVVKLSGPVLKHEVSTLLSTVRSVRGVREVENHLEEHAQPGDIPALQGGRGRQGERFELTQANWSPTTRLLTGAAGGALLLSSRGLLGFPLRIVGAGLLARAVTNLPTDRLLGTGGGRRAIDFRKSVTINADIDDVFDFWSNYDSFPKFMTNVKEVHDLGDGRSRWVVVGPGGTNISWTSQLTSFVPNDVIAWKSEPGSTIQHAGIVRFTSLENGATQADIRLSYNPPGGALGHSIAWLLGEDPKQKLDEDMLRMKSFLETGIPARDAAQRNDARL